MRIEVECKFFFSWKMQVIVLCSRLEEAVDVLKSEKEKLLLKNEEYSSRLEAAEKEFAEFKVFTVCKLL